MAASKFKKMDFEELCLLADQTGVGYHGLNEAELRKKLLSEAE